MKDSTKYLVLQSCHKFLIYLGDLARYRVQLTKSSSKKSSKAKKERLLLNGGGFGDAKTFYFKSLRLLPFQGTFAL